MRSHRARTPGMRHAQRMLATAAESQRTGLPVEELLGGSAESRGRSQRGLTRRELIGAGAGAAAGMALAGGPAGALARGLKRTGARRIAIVGAGLAGLRCAHMLWSESPGSPLAATVYEANPERAGGRCWTLREYFSGGLLTEHGGSFLNSNQIAVRGLGAKLGLQEEIVDGGDLPSRDEVFYIGGSPYTVAEATADWQAFGFDAFKRAVKQARSGGGEARLDAMSVPEWLASTPSGSRRRRGTQLVGTHGH